MQPNVFPVFVNVIGLSCSSFKGSERGRDGGRERHEGCEGEMEEDSEGGRDGGMEAGRHGCREAERGKEGGRCSGTVCIIPLFPSCTAKLYHVLWR